MFNQLVLDHPTAVRRFVTGTLVAFILIVLCCIGTWPGDDTTPYTFAAGDDHGHAACPDGYANPVWVERGIYRCTAVEGR